MHIGLIVSIIIRLGNGHFSHRGGMSSDYRGGSILTEILLSSLASLGGSVHLGHDILEILNHEPVFAGRVPHLNIGPVLHDVAVTPPDLAVLVRLLAHGLV